jgi:hypothetical protein
MPPLYVQMAAKVAARIEYKGISQVFQKPAHLNEQQFLDRCWFIVKNKDTPNVEAYADLWISLKYYEVTYTPQVMDALHKMEKNVWE